MEAAEQHVAQEELCAACIHRHGKQHGVHERETQFVHVDAVCHTKETVACHYRKRRTESVTQRSVDLSHNILTKPLYLGSLAEWEAWRVLALQTYGFNSAKTNFW